MKYIKLLLLGLSVSLLTAFSISVDEIKPKVINSIKSALTTKTKIETESVPDGDTSITIDGKTHTIKKETMDDTRKLLETNNELQQTFIDIVGSQVTDENIATLAYYAEKIGVSIEDLLNQLK